MAGSGNTDIMATKYNTLRFAWHQVSQSIENNTTTIYWEMQLIAGNSGRINSSASKSWSVNVNGVSYSGTNTVGITYNTTKTLASGTTTISHNGDGTKTFSYSFSQQLDITFDGSWIGTKSGSGTGTLNTIPRASSISSIDGNLVGSNVTVNISRASSSFTHKVYFTNFAGGKTLVGDGIGTSCTFVPAMSDCSMIPNSTQGTGIVTVDTYSGGTKIGSTSHSFTLNVPDSVIPSISSIAIKEANPSISPLMGFIQGNSSLNVITTADGSYGSKIVGYKITGIDDNTYNSANFNSSTLMLSGTRTITVTVTDSRGRSVTATKEYVCVPYTSPMISFVNVVRCNEDGTDNEEGTFVKYTFKALISYFPYNECYYQLGYRVNGTNEYTYKTIASNVYTLNDENVVITDVVFDGNLSYDFEFIIKDYFNTVITRKELGTAFALMNFNTSGKGMAIGKVSEKPNAFEFGMDVFDKYGEEIFSPLLGGVGGQCVWASGDWNTACGTRTGFYMGQNMLNKPSDEEWCYVLHLCHNENWLKQIAFSFYGTGIWAREKNNGNWNAWRHLGDI